MKGTSQHEASGSSTARVPPIKLLRDDEKEDAKGSYVMMKLRSVPNEEHPQRMKYRYRTSKVALVNSSSSLLIKHRLSLWGRISEGPQKVAFMRMVLKGDALAHFAQFFITAGNETNATMKRVFVY
jgi:hypothetical protein